MSENGTYIAIDLKSFYASVECVAREMDPLTTNLVVADASRTEKTICLAVSPSLKALGIPGIIVDTDGDFNKIIPNFIAAGVDGFLPMDVNAGMDIVAVRKEFPNLKFIGGFNKLLIEQGKEAIDEIKNTDAPKRIRKSYIISLKRKVQCGKSERT